MAKKISGLIFVLAFIFIISMIPIRCSTEIVNKNANNENTVSEQKILNLKGIWNEGKFDESVMTEENIKFTINEDYLICTSISEEGVFEFLEKDSKKGNTIVLESSEVIKLLIIEKDGIKILYPGEKTVQINDNGIKKFEIIIEKNRELFRATFYRAA